MCLKLLQTENPAGPSPTTRYSTPESEIVLQIERGIHGRMKMETVVIRCDNNRVMHFTSKINE